MGCRAPSRTPRAPLCLASVTVTYPTLVGSKEIVTDAAGYYRFSAAARIVHDDGEGRRFDTLKQEKVFLEVGHLPT